MKLKGRIMTKEEALELENKFRDTLNRYIDSRDKKDWDAIYYLVYNACSACCKKLTKGTYVNSLQDKIMDATCLALENIKGAIESKDELDIYSKRETLNISSSNEYWNIYNNVSTLEKEINRGMPKKLANFVYWICVGILYDRNTQFNEKSISLESYLEEKFDN